MQKLGPIFQNNKNYRNFGVGVVVVVVFVVVGRRTSEQQAGVTGVQVHLQMYCGGVLSPGGQAAVARDTNEKVTVAISAIELDEEKTLEYR